MYWSWDSPFLSRFYQIICELKGTVHSEGCGGVSTYSKKVVLPDIAKTKKSQVFVVFENGVSYEEFFCSQVF